MRVRTLLNRRRSAHRDLDELGTRYQNLTYQNAVLVLYDAVLVLAAEVLVLVLVLGPGPWSCPCD